MIVDRIERAELYYALHREFPATFAVMAGLTRVPREGDSGAEVSAASRITLSRDLVPRARPQKFEYHEAHIDIHCALDGVELIELGSSPEASSIETDEARDFYLADARSDGTILLSSGMFAVFFRGELHKPMMEGGSPRVAKLLAKIADSGPRP